MKCPHCLESFFGGVERKAIVSPPAGQGVALVGLSTVCPACGKPILWIVECNAQTGGDISHNRLVYPKSIARAPLSAEVPEQFAADYAEACLVLPDSAKASAALSRTCLQHLLREVTKVKPGNLAGEIQELLDRGTLPSHISEALDAVRNIGNFAAHPIKSQRTSEVLAVEPGEAEWNLDVLESLFDYYFVQPALLRKKKDALNAKLAEGGEAPDQVSSSYEASRPFAPPPQHKAAEAPH